ncbi:MAG: hypothetical protein ACI90V_009629, partial [Bacillariaceae sp.]
GSRIHVIAKKNLKDLLSSVVAVIARPLSSIRSFARA